MDLEEYAYLMKMKSFRFNRLASLLTKALTNKKLRYKLIHAFDRAHTENLISNHTVEKILKYYEEA